jgi:LysR family transcriptional regulator, benzoate and cis,cis-muconate-responsive activator of ben and cat genes
VETRELTYFVAVAEELHFGRAAERLGIAQPPLSRMIIQLERRLGVTLFERTSRKVALTAAGSVLLTEGRAALGAMAAAERRAQSAGKGASGLILAAKAGASDELLAKLLEAYANELDAVPVELALCEAHQHQRMLQDGQADVALLHLPFDSTVGFDTETLWTEGQVAIFPSAHPLGQQYALRESDVSALPDLPMARWPGQDGRYPEGPGVEVRNLTQLFQMIALGRSTVIVPESCSINLREDLAAVPVIDAPPVTTVIAWPPHSRSRALAQLVRVAGRL